MSFLHVQDFYNWPDESFEEMDSTLAVQQVCVSSPLLLNALNSEVKGHNTKMFLMDLLQYIQQNIRSDCSNIDKILEPPEGQDEGVWKYEHLR